MGFWDSIRKDIKRGIDEGLEAFKEGTEAIKQRAGSLTEDIRKKVKVFELKQKIQVQLTELGGRVYEVTSPDKRKNPMTDDQTKRIIDRIRRIERQVSKLEGKPSKKAVSKGVGKTSKGKAIGRTAPKKTEKTVKRGRRKEA